MSRDEACFDTRFGTKGLLLLAKQVSSSNDVGFRPVAIKPAKPQCVWLPSSGDGSKPWYPNTKAAGKWMFFFVNSSPKIRMGLIDPPLISQKIPRVKGTLKSMMTSAVSLYPSQALAKLSSTWWHPESEKRCRTLGPEPWHNLKALGSTNSMPRVSSWFTGPWHKWHLFSTKPRFIAMFILCKISGFTHGKHAHRQTHTSSE